MTPDDRRLLNAIREGEETAFDLLCDQYRESLYRHLLNLLPDSATADDLLQEVWLRVWTRAGQWDERGSLRAWLFRIATNLALNWLRAAKRRRESHWHLSDDTPEDLDEENVRSSVEISQDPQQLAEQADRQRRLQRLVLELPEEKRAIFRLIVEDGLEPRAVAKALSLPEGTVRSRLHYARRRLTRQWEAFENEGEM